MTSVSSTGNKIIDHGDGKKIVDLGRGNIYLGEGKAEVFLTKEEIGDLCYSFLLMADSKELRYKTESLFDLISEVEEDLKWGSDGTGILKLENGRLTLGYKNRYEDITEIAKEEGFSFWHYIHALGLERTGLAGGESPCEFWEEEPEKTSLRKKLGALGIIGLIAGAASAGIYCGLVKNQGDKNFNNENFYNCSENRKIEPNYATLKKIAEKNDQEWIKKYIWPLNNEELTDTTWVFHEIKDNKTNLIRRLYQLEYKNDKGYIDENNKTYVGVWIDDTENLVKQLYSLKIPYRPITYNNTIYSVLIPTEEFFKNKEKLIKLINQSTGVDEKIVTEDINKLEITFVYPKLLDNVSFIIKDYEEIDVENATSPYGDALKLQKILQDFIDKEYAANLGYIMRKGGKHNDTEFEKLVKSKLKEEGYTIDDLNEMKTKEVLKVLAKLVEDNIEYDDVKADLIEKRAWKNALGLDTPYETLKSGKGVCVDYAFTYQAIKKVLEDDVPKLENVMVVMNSGCGNHAWNNIMYFDGDKLIISPVDLTWDDADGIPLGNEDNSTLTDFSAVDDYHCFIKK